MSLRLEHILREYGLIVKQDRDETKATDQHKGRSQLHMALSKDAFQGLQRSRIEQRVTERSAQRFTEACFPANAL
jgi:hypothetical protein